MIADAIAAQMERHKIRPSQLERMLAGQMNMHTVRRIRKGATGASLRTYEQVLDALGLRLVVALKPHPDITDDEYFKQSIIK